ncbi:DUF1876 domain-containing protein [Actinomadura citrea]|jgi:hypothetical protein|uniref:DUF1876 domain-containing protein n=1 Tax=Actinomadura citrea TaxID=46158 RepID=A0A7Y9KD64_9ACTN|nr:DUF1876 domain-containing protein [Actinomadura citrea]NYE13041.1 hypothetical protein [Actinomadura citrea]GGT88858.1 hypothetical protein GCM10010177_55180 [Actinomadura citrea]
MKAKEWSVELYITEDGMDTVAQAILFSGGERKSTGRGHARRNPVDREVPEIGDELAVSRALADLADRLQGVASKDIAQFAGPS